jgi:hypothetical protein
MEEEAVVTGSSSRQSQSKEEAINVQICMFWAWFMRYIHMHPPLRVPSAVHPTQTNDLLLRARSMHEISRAGCIQCRGTIGIWPPQFRDTPVSELRSRCMTPNISWPSTSIDKRATWAPTTKPRPCILCVGIEQSTTLFRRAYA